jgi:hypothetical protein
MNNLEQKPSVDLRAAGGRYKAVGGSLALLVGLCVTGASYLMAGPGGQYLLLFLPIIFGVIYLVWGLVEWLWFSLGE